MITGKSKESEGLFNFFSRKFEEAHANNPYESSYKDFSTLDEIQKRRGLIETYILIEAYFTMDITKAIWKFNKNYSRNVNYFRLTINEMLFDKKVQAALNFKTLAKTKLIEQGFLDG